MDYAVVIQDCNLNSAERCFVALQEDQFQFELQTLIVLPCRRVAAQPHGMSSTHSHIAFHRQLLNAARGVADVAAQGSDGTARCVSPPFHFTLPKEINYRYHLEMFQSDLLVTVAPHVSAPCNREIFPQKFG